MRNRIQTNHGIISTRNEYIFPTLWIYKKKKTNANRKIQMKHYVLYLFTHLKWNTIGLNLRIDFKGSTIIANYKWVYYNHSTVDVLNECLTLCRAAWLCNCFVKICDGIYYLTCTLVTYIHMCLKTCIQTDAILMFNTKHLISGSYESS